VALETILTIARVLRAVFRARLLLLTLGARLLPLFINDFIHRTTICCLAYRYIRTSHTDGTPLTLAPLGYIQAACAGGHLGHSHVTRCSTTWDVDGTHESYAVARDHRKRRLLTAYLARSENADIRRDVQKACAVELRALNKGW